jgi:hypothetical protein
MHSVEESRARLQRLLAYADSEFAPYANLALKELDQKPVTKARVIVIEGLDGTGKSTAQQNLVKRLDALDMRTPPTEIRGAGNMIRDKYDKKEEDIRRAYYEVGNLLVSRALREVSEGKTVVIDRYW